MTRLSTLLLELLVLSTQSQIPKRSGGFSVKKKKELVVNLIGSLVSAVPVTCLGEVFKVITTSSFK
jgi:hypothetical protein